MTLEGRSFRLVNLATVDGRLEAIPAGIEVSATFEDGHVSGTGGCNRFMGPYVLEGDRLEVGPLASTMMACPEPAMGVESAFHAAVARVVRLEDLGDTLELVDADGTVVLRFATASVTPLIGTAWTATGINNGRGGVVSLLAGTEATALFADDGRVAGSAGCNRFTATFVVAGSTITIGPAAATRRACLDPDGVMDQEAWFLAALPRATRLAIDGDRLDLRDDDGALQVSFRAEGVART